MVDAIRKAAVFLQDVGEVLGKRNDERTKCPRCRGSGLLNLHSNWRQSQPSPSNAPCLFCEGVGVMPIVGLRGYVIGRTDAMLSTKEIKAHLVIPDNLEPMDSGRKSTRFSARQHVKIPPQVLYNPLSNPVWVLEAEREAALSKSSGMEAVEHFFDHRECEDWSPVGLIGLDHAGWRHRHRFYARTSASFSTPNISSQTGDMSPSVPLDSRVHAADGQLHSAGADSTGFKEAAEQVVDVGSFSHVQERNNYVVSSTGGRRSSRRPRNRIREKAGKEAEARAQKIQKLHTQASDTPANLWSPLLRMCRSVMLSRTSTAQKC